MKEGDLVELIDGEEFEIVLDTVYGSKRVLLLHPTDAPYGIMFVCVYCEQNGTLSPVDNSIICNRIVSMYERREGINSNELAKEFISECDNDI